MPGRAPLVTASLRVPYEAHSKPANISLNVLACNVDSLSDTQTHQLAGGTDLDVFMVCLETQHKSAEQFFTGVREAERQNLCFQTETGHMQLIVDSHSLT